MTHPRSSERSRPARPPKRVRTLAAAVRLHRLGRHDEASEAYEAILRRRRDDPDALHLLGVLSSQAGDHERAASLISRALSGRPRFPAAFHNLGHALQAIGRDNEAAAAYRQAIAQDPRSAASYNNLGNILHSRGDGAEAVVMFRRAVLLAPDYAAAYSNLGSALLALGRNDEALDALRRATSLDPRDAGGLNNFGKALAAAGEPTAAVAAYRRAIAADPGFAVAYNNLGAALAGEKSIAATDEAIDILGEAVRLDPAYASAHFNLGLALAERGRDGEAIISFERALAMQPHLPRAHLHCGRSCLLIGRYEESIGHFLRTVTLGAVTEIEERQEPARELNSDNRAHDALHAFKAVMDRAGIPFFLCFGTLLGCVREGRFLSHDTDIDVGVWEDTDCRRIIEAFAADPSFALLHELRHDGRMLYIGLRWDGRCSLDIFVFRRIGGQVMSGVIRDGVLVAWMNTPFDLAPRPFIGATFLAPADVEGYLTESYGDWRTPETVFDAAISANNLAGVRELAMTALQYSAILNALRAGRRVRAARLCEHRLAQVPDDAFAATLLRKLRDADATSGR